MGHDLEIEIRAGSTPGTYDVEVDSPAGTATGTMELDAAAILGRRRELAASVLASAVTSRSTFSTLERPVRDVGHSLFESLFSGRVYGRYTASLQRGSLVLKLKTAAQQVRVTIAYPRLKSAGSLSAQVAGHKASRVTVTVHVTDAGRLATKLTSKLKPRS